MRWRRFKVITTRSTLIHRGSYRIKVLKENTGENVLNNNIKQNLFDHEKYTLIIASYLGNVHGVTVTICITNSKT